MQNRNFPKSRYKSKNNQRSLKTKLLIPRLLKVIVKIQIQVPNHSKNNFAFFEMPNISISSINLLSVI